MGGVINNNEDLTNINAYGKFGLGLFQENNSLINSSNINFNPNASKSKNKKVIPFVNNVNTNLSQNIDINQLQNQNQVNPYKNNNLDINVINNCDSENKYSEKFIFSSNKDYSNRQNSHLNISSINNNIDKNIINNINNIFSNQVSNFSQAYINNKIHNEDQFNIISQSKKPSNLFHKNLNTNSNLMNSKSNITFNNKILNRDIISSLNTNFNPNLNLNKSYDQKPQEENEKEKNDTDEDQHEYQQIQEILNFYLDEEKIISDKKLKISLIRKIVPFYKFLNENDNKIQYDEILEKIIKIINEKKNDIEYLLKFENLRNIREKVFQKFCKMTNKFLLKLNEMEIKEFGGNAFFKEIPDSLKERIKNLYTKINDYYEKNMDLAYY
jgi:hypothetical protein